MTARLIERMPRSPARLVLALLAVAMSACATTTPVPSDRSDPLLRDPEFARLVGWMTGSFSSAAQAKADPDFYDIRLEMVRIWEDRPDAVWLYVEQASAESLDRPYRQRIYRLRQLAEGEYESAVFTLPGDPLMYAGAYDEPERLDDLAPASLTAREGCAITLELKNEAYIGSTNERDCMSDLRGATYATSDVRITGQHLETWDRGWDDQGNQVWGSTEGPYVFERVSMH